MVLRIPDSLCGIVHPQPWEARGWAQPFLEQSAVISQRGVPWCPLTCVGEPGHSPHTSRPGRQHKVHMVWCQWSLGSHPILLLAMWLLTMMLPSLEAQSVYSPDQWERMTLTCEPQKWTPSHNRDFQPNFLYILAIFEDYNQCNNKPPCCRLIGSKISF